jgi:hypothetical protein
LVASFPYLRGFGGINGRGAHFLGSMQAMDAATAEDLAARLPPKAKEDLMEWMDKGTYPTLADCFRPVLANEAPIALILNPDPKIQITDDQPFNEYYLLRRWGVYSP